MPTAPKKSEPTPATREPTSSTAPVPATLDEIMREPTLDSLMALGGRLADLTEAASIALANFHFTQSRVDHGSMDRGGLRNAHAVAPVDATAMARLHTMATACREFANAMRNAAAIGVHK